MSKIVTTKNTAFAVDGFEAIEGPELDVPFGGADHRVWCLFLRHNGKTRRVRVDSKEDGEDQMRQIAEQLREASH